MQIDRIYMKVDRERGIMKVVNTYSHAVFCARFEKGKRIDFYVYKRSESAPFVITDKVWCAIPKPKV